MISTIMLRKLRLRQKNGFLIKKRVCEKSERKVRGVAKIFTNTSDSLHATLSILDVCGGSGHAFEANPLWFLVTPLCILYDCCFKTYLVYLQPCEKIPFVVYEHFSHKSQPVLTCSKLTIETLDQGVKYVQS